jgi:hypothetical protein
MLKDENSMKSGGNGKRTSLFSITAVKSFITLGPWWEVAFVADPIKGSELSAKAK